jgi:hypothetical protein
VRRGLSRGRLPADLVEDVLRRLTHRERL